MSTDDGQRPRQPAGDAAVVQDAFEAMPWPMAAVEGPTHTIVAANAACRALAGQPDLIGKPAWQAFQGFTKKQIADSLDWVYATGEPYSARDWPIQGDRYLDLTLTPWLGPGGLRGVLVAQVDVTNRVREVTAALQPPAARARPRPRSETIVVQEAMLPSKLPVLPGVRIAARYLPAVADEPAGADWFDAFPLPDGRIALMVGDVADRGTAASAAMGRLRAVLTHALTVQQDLAAVLIAADRFAAGDAALGTTTLCIGVLNPADWAFSYATCGHPPPLLTDSGGTARFLPGTGARPLGAGVDSPVLRSAVLAPGDVLLLYSDGLVERAGRTLDDGMADLAIVAGDSVANRSLRTWAAGTPAERASQLTVELLTRAGYADDVTTLAAWRQPVPLPPLTIESPASRDAVPTLRRAFGDWLESLGIALGDRHLAELSIAEVVTNAVDHAYPPGMPGPVRLEAAVGADAYLETRISDRGRWRVPDTSEKEHGQGLSVALQFADELRVSHPPQGTAEPLGARGTVVAMRHPLHRQPMLAPLTVRPPGVRAVYPSFAIKLAVAKPAPHVLVSGPVDFTTADQLLSRLLAACRAGVLPLIVDLSDATLLATAGVRVLYRIAAQLAVHEQDLTLICEPDSPAAAVLDLAGLPSTPQ